MQRIPALLLVLLMAAGCASATPAPTVDSNSSPAVAVTTPTQAQPAETPTLVPAVAAPTQQTTASQPTPTFAGGAQVFSDPGLGISFSYPSTWGILSREPDAPPGVTLHAPPVGEGPEPIIFAITVDVNPAPGNSVKDVVDQQLAQVPADLQSSIKRRTITIGGESAEEVVGLPSRAGAIEAFALHAGLLYLIILQPYDEENVSLTPFLPSARQAYDLVLASWKFLK